MTTSMKATTTAPITLTATVPGSPRPRTGAETRAVCPASKARHRDYPTAPGNGWPIATGVIDGTCRHLVKDRMDPPAPDGLPEAEASATLGPIRSVG